jgi:hypothetical protein
MISPQHQNELDADLLTAVLERMPVGSDVVVDHAGDLVATDGEVLLVVRATGAPARSGRRSAVEAEAVLGGCADVWGDVRLDALQVDTSGEVPTSIACPDCDDGSSKCGQCDGSGYEECPTCGQDVKCPDCGGDGDQACPRCRGTARLAGPPAPGHFAAVIAIDRDLRPVVAASAPDRAEEDDVPDDLVTACGGVGLLFSASRWRWATDVLGLLGVATVSVSSSFSRSALALASSDRRVRVALAALYR